jgi:flagellar hook-associated protein 2
VQFSGLASGMNDQEIISELIAIDRQPEQQIQNQITGLQQQETAVNAISAQLISLQTAAKQLDNVQSFQLVKASSSDEDVATASAETGATTGTHTIVVNNLATAQTLAGTVQSSETTPLGFSGQFVLNGQAINVSSSDSLQTLAGNINSANVGVEATILSPNSNQYVLTLTSTTTGTQGQMTLSDAEGGSFLSGTLGLLGTGTTLANPIPSTGTATGAASGLFTDGTTSIGTLEGQTSPESGTVSITNSSGASAQVSIDLGTDSLSNIAANINAAGLSGVTANVVSVTNPNTGDAEQQLQINGATNFTDSNGVLANLGVLQSDLASGAQTTAAKNASFTIDGIQATSSTNSTSTLIPGVTVNLQSAGTTNLTISADTSTLQTNIQNFVTQFNSTMSLIGQYDSYDASTSTAGPLFGNSTIQSVITNLVGDASAQVSGVTPTLSLLSQIGITLDSSGTPPQLDVDSTALSQALSGNLQSLGDLFQQSGVASSPDVEFVSATSQTQVSPSSGYSVDVTQAATQGSITASNAMTGPLQQNETLTFGGPLFNTADTATTGGYQISLSAGSTLDQIVSQINSDPTISKSVVASDSGGQLQLTSTNYGSASEFTVYSGVDSSTPGSTGIGTTLLDAKGQDVEGTINGEMATGNGQFLTGSQVGGSGVSNGEALGLQIRVTATTPGDYGTITFSRGVADAINNYVNQETDPISGDLTQAVTALQNQVSDDNTSIATIEANVQSQQAYLQSEFSNAESAISQIQAASAGLSQLSDASTGINLSS